MDHHDPCRFVFPAQFPVGVVFDADVLGTVIPISLEGVFAVVHAPRYNAANHDALLPPAVAPLDAILTQSGSHDPGAPHFESWGHIVSSNEGRPVAARVETLTIEIPELQADEARAAQGSAEQWMRRVVRWIEVLGKQPVRLGFGARGSHEVIGNDWYDIGVSPAARHHVGDVVIQGVVRSRGFPADEWSRACSEASRDVEPPLAHCTLADARDALLRGDARRAVIDAATAVEVAVTMALREALAATTPEPVVDTVMKQTSDISRRLHLARAAQLPVPIDAKDALLDQRNAVVHRGEEPSDARKAFEVAEQIVCDLVPLHSVDSSAASDQEPA